MAIELLYWELSVSEPAGHVGLKVDDRLVTFWPIVVRPDDTRGPVPSYINHDENLEKFTAGLRKLALDDLKSKKLRLPSGLKTYQIIYDNFEQIRSGQVMLDSLFGDIDPNSDILDDQRDTVIAASKALAEYVLTCEKTQQDIINAGEPDEIFDLSFLSSEKINIRSRDLTVMLQNKNLTWYAKVGAKTDDSLNAGNPMHLTFFVSADTTGLKYYVNGKVRHNCASFILDLLEAGGLDDQHISSYKESNYIGHALQQSIEFNAQSKDEKPDPKQLKGADMVNTFIPVLFRYGRKPISDWFGTTPAVLKEIVKVAIAEHDNPPPVRDRECVLS